MESDKPLKLSGNMKEIPMEVDLKLVPGKEGKQTKTKSDAYLRVLDMRMGSLADFPSVEYLEALKQQLHQFLESVEEQLVMARYNEKRNAKW